MIYIIGLYHDLYHDIISINIRDFDIFVVFLDIDMGPGRKSANVWEKFGKSRKDGNSGWWAVCKKCNAGMQGIPERLIKHVEICESDIPKKNSKPAVTVTSFVSSTTMTEKEKMDEALADFFNEWNTQVLKSFCIFLGQVMFPLTEEN